MFEDPKRTKKYLKIALFGKGGSGKTRFALSFPSPCLVDSERGSDPYVEKYDFKVWHLGKFMKLKEPLDWLRANPGKFETLIIDSATVFYGDLVYELTQIQKNRSGKEIMTKDLWGIEKRRWAALCNELVHLPMHVIMTFRAKDEYVEVPNGRGEEILKKTGEEYPDADKQTEYIFDLGFRCYTEEDKKQKESKFFFACTKSRYDWMPKYSVHEITKQRPYPAIFEKHVLEMLDAPEAPSGEKPEEPQTQTEPTPAEDVQELGRGLPPEKGGVERVGEVLDKFASPGDPNEPQATPDEIKTLMTRVTDLTWPDGSPFTNVDGKKMIKALYTVESTKDLRRFQVDFLYREFGEVLAGRAELSRDETGVPFVIRKSGIGMERKKGGREGRTVPK